MTNETDRSPADQETLTTSAPSSASPRSAQRKPRFAIFVATAAGLGYLPKAPGTWGSLAGILLAMLPWWGLYSIGLISRDSTIESVGADHVDLFLYLQIAIAFWTAIIGVFAASRAAKYWNQKDPPRVVIDELSGQHLTYLLGCSVPIWWKPTPLSWIGFTPGLITANSPLNWKYLLLGFILFRVFDIWKPFPARQAESLSGGWGIMADDWIAGIYAGLGLWIARAVGL
jgi:phosphatidylglycerophosphatase A